MKNRKYPKMYSMTLMHPMVKDGHVDAERIKRIQDLMTMSDEPQNDLPEEDYERPFVFEYTDPSKFKITREWLNQYGLTRAGWIEEQLAILNVPWPTPKGWSGSLIGKEITVEKRLEFERFDKKPFFSKLPKPVKKKKIKKEKKKYTLEDFYNQRYVVKKVIKKNGKEIKINPYGYELVDLNGGLQLAHWHISELHDGKSKPGYHIHHCDMDKLNNDIENLVQIPGDLHGLIHKVLKNVKKLMPSKKEILEIHLPEFINGSNQSLLKIKRDHLKYRRENRKFRSPERIKSKATTILIKH